MPSQFDSILGQRGNIDCFEFVVRIQTEAQMTMLFREVENFLPEFSEFRLVSDQNVAFGNTGPLVHTLAFVSITFVSVL